MDSIRSIIYVLHNTTTKLENNMIEYFVIAVFSVILCIFTYETLYENIKRRK